MEINVESNTTDEFYFGFSDSPIPCLYILSKHKRIPRVNAYSDFHQLPYSLESLCG